MADPSNPMDPSTIAASTAATEDNTAALADNAAATTDLNNKLTDLGTQYSAYQSLLRGVDNVQNLVTTGLKGLEEAATKAGVDLSNLTAISKEQATAFALTSSAAVTAREAFTGLSDVDYSQIFTLSDKIKDIKEAFLGGGTAANVAKEGIDGLINTVRRMGATQAQITDAMSKGVDGVLSLAEGFMKHADNMRRAELAYIQISAQAGGLNNIMDKQGHLVTDLSDRMQRQTMIIADNIKATGLSANELEKYWAQLGKIPGTMNETVAVGGKFGDQTSMLTATLRVAAGAGRSVADVIQDMNTAYKDYNIVGEKALSFSARISDVAAKLKAPIQDVTGALRNSADAFRMFATGQDNASAAAESMAKSLNTYAKALESTGLSATAAVEVSSQLTNQVMKMTTGQLAYISQQSGGGGGLRGAAQETLKLQKDPGAVVQDAMGALQRQFGQIVTLQQAATSEALASQNIKQTAMLQQLLGPLAKDQASANRILEAMKNVQEGNPAALADALKPDIVQNTADRGLEIQKRSVTYLDNIRGDISRMRYLADHEAGRAVRAISAAGAEGGPPTLAQGKIQGMLSRMMTESGITSGRTARDTALEMAGGHVESTSQMEAASLLKSAARSLSEGHTVLKSTFDIMRNAPPGEAGAPSTQVGVAARTAVATYPANGAAPGATTRQGPGGTPAAGAPHTVNIVGNFTIDCPTCGRPHDVSDQAKIFPQQYNH